MLWFFFTAYGQAPDVSYEHVRTAADCVLEARPKTHHARASLRATCAWSEVDPAVLSKMVTTYSTYTDWLWPLKECRVIREEESRTLVYQRQKIAPLSDREVLLWMSQSDQGGTTQVTWHAATEEPLELQPGSVRTPVNKGMWSIQAAPSGGSHVVHEIEVDAGGVPVPAFLMDWIRQRGLLSILKDVRRQAAQKK